MKKSVKTRRCACAFLWIGVVLLVLSIAAVAMYAMAEVQEVVDFLADTFKVEAAYEWPEAVKAEHLTIALGVSIILVIIALIVFAAARSQKAREDAEEEAEALRLAEEEAELEALRAGVEAVVPYEEEVEAEKKNWKQVLAEKATPENLKKVGKVAVPVATACIMAAAIVKTVRKQDRKNFRKSFYRHMG